MPELNSELDPILQQGLDEYNKLMSQAMNIIATDTPNVNNVNNNTPSKEEFDTGAVRDTREGKGRFDLVSPYFVAKLALLLEKGAINYGDRNWEKGMPISRIIDSCKRHINQFEMGKTDEEHLVNAACNLMFIIHILEMIKLGKLPTTLDDLPYYER